MEKLRIEGLIVSTAPFQDYDRIMTILTPNEGLLKFILKGKNGMTVFASPFMVVELIYTKSRSELLKCHEISMLDYNLALRNHLGTLAAACDMLQVVKATQMPGKSCPSLYQLLLVYLNKLPAAHDPATLSASFRLKTLRHEGLWRNLSRCSHCECEVADHFIFTGDTYCKLHAPQYAVEISSSEKEIFELLAFSRDLSLMASLPMTQNLTKKIKLLFDDLWSA